MFFGAKLFYGFFHCRHPRIRFVDIWRTLNEKAVVAKSATTAADGKTFQRLFCGLKKFDIISISVLYNNDAAL